jgi:excisionase family DNA binding protein
MAEKSDLLTTQEVADTLRVGRTTVYELYGARELRGPRVGLKKDAIRITKESVNDYISRNTPQEPEPAPATRRRRSRPATRNVNSRFLTLRSVHAQSERPPTA